MQNHLRLDDLLARDLTPQWFEGVAVVQLLCRQLRARGADASGFPRAADILIGPGGSIAIAGESAGNPVQAAAHVLALMLSDDAPVRLRLAVSQATATESGYATLTDFSEALAYFERPNPQLIVETFRQRAILAPRREMAPPAPIATTPDADKRPTPQPVAARPRVSRLAVIGATISAVACTSVWLIGRDVVHVAAPGVVIADGGSTAPANVSRPTRATNAEAPPLPKQVVGTGAATPLAKTIVVAPRSGREAAPELVVLARTLEYSYPDLLPLAAFEPQTVPAVVALSERASEDNAGIEEASGRIYTKADPEVTRPVNVYPRFPAEPAGVNSGNRTILELTIAADGLVERVKMLTAPRDIHEFMLLSAAKAWRFEPARIDGRPVRFRHTMVLLTMP